MALTIYNNPFRNSCYIQLIYLVDSSDEKIERLSWQAQLKDMRLYDSPAVKLLSMLTSKNPPHLVLLGKSGAGKGTLAKMLSKKYGYVHISIGDLHRAENQKGTELGLRIRKLVQENKIVSQEMTEITFKMLSGVIDEILRNKKTFILDNFPTYPMQIPFILEVMDKYKLKNRVIIIVPELPDNEALKRLTNRVVCSLSSCGRGFNLLSVPPKEKDKCDSCGSKLMRRIDDEPAIIQNKRLPFYRDNIAPVVNQLAEKIDLFFLNDIFGLFQKYLGLSI